MVAVQLSSTFPRREATLKLEESKITLKALKEAASELLKIPDLTEYSFAQVGFAEDVRHLDGLPDSTELSFAAHGTFLLIASSTLRPPRPKPSDDAGEEEDEMAKKFKGLTAENVLKMLSLSKGKPVRRSICLEFIDTFSPEVLGSQAFLTLPEKVVFGLLSRPSLCAEEKTIFEALMRWGKAEAKRQAKGDRTEDFAKLVAPLLPAVRFPQMSHADIATVVQPSGVLTSQQVLELFQFVVSEEDDKKLGDSLSMFNSKPRSGSSYGRKGTYTRLFQISDMTGQWSWGESDHVSSSRVAQDRSAYPRVTSVLNGESLQEWKAGTGFNFPRGGTGRECGIYSYPSGPHSFTLQMKKGKLKASGFRFYCSRKEGSAEPTYECRSKDGEWHTVPIKQALPTLGNGSNTHRWLQADFTKSELFDEFRVTVPSQQCSFHCCEFVIS